MGRCRPPCMAALPLLLLDRTPVATGQRSELDIRTMPRMHGPLLGGNALWSRHRCARYNDLNNPEIMRKSCGVGHRPPDLLFT